MWKLYTYKNQWAKVVQDIQMPLSMAYGLFSCPFYSLTCPHHLSWTINRAPSAVFCGRPQWRFMPESWTSPVLLWCWMSPIFSGYYELKSLSNLNQKHAKFFLGTSLLLLLFLFVARMLNSLFVDLLIDYPFLLKQIILLLNFEIFLNNYLVSLWAERCQLVFIVSHPLVVLHSCFKTTLSAQVHHFSCQFCLVSALCISKLFDAETEILIQTNVKISAL